MLGKDLTVLGAGYLGSRLAELADKAGYQVTTVRRSKSALQPQIRSICADLADPRSFLSVPLSGAVVYCLSPSGSDPESYRVAYRNILLSALQAAAAANCRRFILTSSTSVYERADGAVVTEHDELLPQKAHSQIILEAELLVQQLQSDGLSVRIGGIYGPMRLVFLKRVYSGLETPSLDAKVFTNRIHVDDAARAILHLLETPVVPTTVNLVDSYAAPRNEVIEFLRREMRLPALSPSGLSEPSLLRGNKRVSSKLLQELGFKFNYPTFESGYRALLPSFMSLADTF